MKRFILVLALIAGFKVRAQDWDAALPPLKDGKMYTLPQLIVLPGLRYDTSVQWKRLACVMNENFRKRFDAEYAGNGQFEVELLDAQEVLQKFYPDTVTPAMAKEYYENYLEESTGQLPTKLHTEANKNGTFHEFDRGMSAGEWLGKIPGC